MFKPKNYKLYTIKELITALEEMAETSQSINLDSYVVFSDFNMSGFQENIKLCPVNRYGHWCIGLFHSLYSNEDSEVQHQNL